MLVFTWPPSVFRLWAHRQVNFLLKWPLEGLWGGLSFDANAVVRRIRPE